MNGQDNKEDTIIELNFKTSPFKYIIYTENLEPICEEIIEDFNKNKKDEGNIITNSNTIKYKVYEKEEKDEKVKMINFTYKDETFNIYANPINFYYFFSKIILFKVYSEEYLEEVKMALVKDFKIVKKEEGYYLYPQLYTIFSILSNRLDEEKFSSSNLIELPLKALDPFQIDENEGLETENKFDLIYNNERKEFIDEIKKYVSSNKIIPMMIAGNDGIGKSVSLQFYSFFKSHDIKLYINFEIMNKIGFKKYYLTELMRCFLPFENTFENRILKFKQYLDFIKILVLKKSFQENNLFDCLQNLNFKNQKIIYILDQYQEQYQKQYLIKNFIDFKKKLNFNNDKIIICCSLNDKNVKEILFINDEDENNNLCDNLLLSNIIKDNQNEDNEIENKINKSKINLEENEEEMINFFDLLYFKNILEERKENLAKSNDISNLYKINNIDDSDKSIGNKKESNENFDLSNKFKIDIKEDPIIEVLKKEKSKEINNNHKETTNIYYNEIISIEPLIKQLKDEQLYKCMNNFKFFPKYYKRFLIFKKNYNNKGNIYDNFTNLQLNRIKNKLKKFFYKYDNENVYQSLISLREIIINAKNNPINYKALYSYSKIYPFKYLSIKMVGKSNSIYINQSLFNQKFDINFSFPFIEYVVNKIIEEYNNDSSIDIEKLSGSAFGNAFEYKISENIVTNKYFSEKVFRRYVWTTSILKENQVNNKKNEIEDKKKKGDIRYINCPYLDDIYKADPLKYNIYYIKPENQINYLVDSLMIIKSQDNKYIMIAFQITKYKNKDEIYSKSIYENYLKKNIKIKFENLYNIKIVEIYFWYILSNEFKYNEDTCMFLNAQKIKYIFYSHRDKCFYKERSINKVEKIEFFFEEKSKIYSLKEEKENNDISSFNPTTYQFLINQIEDNIIFEMENIEKNKNNETNKNINYEKIRNKIIPNSKRIIINEKQKEIITNILKSKSSYLNEIQLLYLFCIPFIHLRFFINDENLFFIFKYNNKNYLYNNKDFYEIKKNSKKEVISLSDITIYNMMTQYLKEDIDYDKSKINLEEIKDLKDTPIIYMFKIYFFGDRLKKKSEKNY